MNCRNIRLFLFNFFMSQRRISPKFQEKPKNMAERLRDEGIQVSPLRTLDDFVLASSRFQLPERNSDPLNRICNNLIYYQTNYFLVIIIWSLLALAMHKEAYIIALLAMGLVYFLSIYGKFTNPNLQALHRDNPGLVGLATFLIGSYLVFLLTSFSVLVSAFLIPAFAVLTHSILRLRNMKNKLMNVTESMGLCKKTPMGLFLEDLGIEHTFKIS